MPRKVCVAAGCDDLAEIGKSHCAHHAQRRKDRLAARRASAQLSDHAASARALYQSREWRRAAKRFLAKHPLCADCAELGAVAAATQVDLIRLLGIKGFRRKIAMSEFRSFSTQSAGLHRPRSVFLRSVAWFVARPR